MATTMLMVLGEVRMRLLLGLTRQPGQSARRRKRPPKNPKKPMSP
jgi:hypothetical protein